MKLGFKYHPATDTLNVQPAELQERIQDIENRLERIENKLQNTPIYCKCGDQTFNVRYGDFLYAVCAKCDLVGKLSA